MFCKPLNFVTLPDNDNDDGVAKSSTVKYKQIGKVPHAETYIWEGDS